MSKQLKKAPRRLLTDAFREIKNTRSRFLSLLVLSALAVCFLAGLRATAPDMKNTADRYFDRQQLMDLRVASTLGLTGEDVALLSARPGVKSAEGGWTVDAILSQGDKDYIVKAHSLTETVNVPRLTEGRLPQRADECLIEPLLGKEAGLAVGDAVTLDTGTGSFAQALSRTEFTIVGMADSPLYIGVERGASTLGTGKVAAFVLLPPEAFALDYYTDAYLLAEGGGELLCYSGAYEDLTDALADQLEPLGEERAALRGAQVLDEAEKLLSDAETELADAQAEAERELSDARGELADARKELDDGWAEYYDGQQELADEIAKARREISDGETELSDALAELTDGETELADARKELDDGWAEYYDGYAEYTDGQRDYEDGLADYQEGYQEYMDGRTEYADGLKEYERGKSRLAGASAQLTDGENRYAAGKAQFDALTGAVLAAAEPALSGMGLSVTTQEELLAALRSADPAVSGAAGGVADGVLAGMSANLEQGAQLLEGIAQTEQGIAGLRLQIAQAQEAGQDTAALEGQLSALEGALAALQGQADAAGLTGQTPEGLRAQKDALPANSAALLGAEDTLKQSRAQLDSGWSSYSAGRAQLRDAKKELDDAAKKLEEAKAELKDAKVELMNARYSLTDAGAKLVDALAELEDGEREYADGLADYQDGFAEYQDGLVTLADAKKELADETAKARRELADARIKLQDGESEYANGLKEYEDGKAEADRKIADAKKELEQARRDVEDLGECQWYILGRKTNMGYLSYSMDADRMGRLAQVFPVIFFLVAALVCLTTMTRMVEEQRVAIGGMKALGYSKGAIAVKYVGYGFLASFLGALAGLAVGLTLLPWIICTAWTILYTIGEIQYGVEPATSALACAAAVGTVTLSALAACFSTLAAVPAQLMRPKAPPMGKRILLERVAFVWKRLSFNRKIALRNLFRYQKRFWMTVIGISGCAALIVTAFGLRDSIFDVMTRQFDHIYQYTASFGLVDKVTDGELREVETLLESSELVTDWTLCRTETVTAETERYTVDATLQVFPDQETLERFVRLRHRTDSEAVVFPDHQVVLTEKLAALLGAAAGESILIDGDSRVEAVVADVTEHYIQHYIYMTDSCYEELFGKAPADNAGLMDYPFSDPAAPALDGALVALDGVTSLNHLEDTRRTFSSSLESVDYAVVLIIVCAAALAFVVLYNLTNINITERLRELATLKVLGFYDGELSAYVYRENVILTVFGVGLGMALGKLLHQWLILTVEIDLLMFGRTLRLESYLYAAVLTALFSVLVNLSAHWKLKKLDMVESLKTVE